MPRVTDPDDPLRQFNVRIPESMHAAIEQRRLRLAGTRGESISRDEWARRAFAYLLSIPEAQAPETLTTSRGRATRPIRRNTP